MRNDIMIQTPEPLSEMIHSGEMYCTAYCCGLGAFETGKDQVAAWVKGKTRAEASLALEQLNAVIESVKPDTTITFYEGFGTNVDAEECLEWLNSWKISLEQTLNLTN